MTLCNVLLTSLGETAPPASWTSRLPMRGKRQRAEFPLRDAGQLRDDPFGVTEGSLGTVTGHPISVAVVTPHPLDVESSVLDTDAFEPSGPQIQRFDHVTVPPGPPEEFSGGHALGSAQPAPHRSICGVVGSSANRPERRFAPGSLRQKKPAGRKEPCGVESHSRRRLDSRTQPSHSHSQAPQVALGEAVGQCSEE